MALLIEVHPHHERLAEGARELDEPDPRRMDAQDVADHEFASVGDRAVDDRLRFGDGFGQRLFAEHVAAGLDRGARVRRMRLGVGIDADDVRLRGLQRVVIVSEGGDAAEFLAERVARFGATADDAHDLELRHLVVRAGVARAHVAATCDENTKRSGH